MRRILLRGGAIATPSMPGATAMFVVGPRVCWIGDDSDAARYADQADLIVELDGRWVAPGFVDAHAHLAMTGFATESVDLSRATSLVAALDMLRAAAGPKRDDCVTTGSASDGSISSGSVATGQVCSSSGLVTGYGWDETQWPERRPPTAAEIDRALGGRSAYLSRVDSHSAIVSGSLAIAVADVEGYTDGRVERDAHHAARREVDARRTHTDRARAITAALRLAARQGITSVHELNAPHIAPRSDQAIVESALADGDLPDVTCYWGAACDDTGSGVQGFAGDYCVDGAIGSRTAALRAPYSDADTSGNRYLDAVTIAQHVVDCTRRGLQAGFHAIGDDACDAVAEGFEKAAGSCGESAIAAARHRVEHLEMPDDHVVAILARLGVVASVQPSFDAAWGHLDGLYERRLGSDRARPMNPFGSMHRAGIVLAFGSDSPVTPFDPWGAIRAALHHHEESERLSITVAFEAHTRGGHRARHDDASGVLTVGAPATYCVWDTGGMPQLAPGTAAPRCVRTVVNGRTIFDLEMQT